jgi:KaiC/GvpD/RAD55 family RecA-like ATPase
LEEEERISTGVPNLDSLIAGGIPRGFTVMVAGNSGTGKTILCSQFIYEGLTSTKNNASENGIFISFSESKSQFYTNSKKLGMDFEKFENQAKFIYLDFVSVANDGIQDAFEEIISSIRAVNAKRVVLDSFSALAMSFKDKVESRITIQVFLGKIMRAEGITSLIISEIPYGRNDLGNGIEESVADAVIKLEHGPDNASPIFLKVLKMRGTAINREKHVCSITNKGMILYPKQRITMTADFPTSERRVTSGIANFDEKIDGGGFVEGTLTAVIGASGSGKSTFAFQFIAEGVKVYDEPGIFCSLEDSRAEIKRMAKGYGYDFQELELESKEGEENSQKVGQKSAEGEDMIEEEEKQGSEGDKNGGQIQGAREVDEAGEGGAGRKNKARLSIVTYNHTDYNPDAFIASLEEEIKTKKPKRLVIDGLSIYELKYRDQLFDIVERISSLIRKYQITTLITLLGSQKNIFQVTELNLSPLFHNIILLRFVELYGRMKRVLMILKVSMSHQDGAILEFKISSDKGFELVGPIGDDYTGIFSGIARK